MGLPIWVLFVTCLGTRDSGPNYASFHPRGQGTVEGESRAQPKYSCVVKPWGLTHPHHFSRLPPSALP